MTDLRWKQRYVTWLHIRRHWKRRDDNARMALWRLKEDFPMGRITKMRVEGFAGDRGLYVRRLRFSAYGNEQTPPEIMDIVIRYENLYEVRQVPVSIDRFVRLLRTVTGWPIVVGKTGMKRWVEYVQSEEVAEGSEAHSRRSE